MSLPLLPTTVIGSHAIPSWLWTALDAMREGKYGETDTRETLDDAVNVAIRDQERAGVDIITDGEMRRWYFVQSFYSRFEGLETEEPLRKQGVYGYDSPPRYHPVERLKVPSGLGIVDEYNYLRMNTDRPTKATCPGPLTLTIHVRLKDDRIYRDRLELAYEVSDVVNAELKALVAAGADYIQLDEPSYSIIPGSSQEWVRLFNKTVEGVDARIALHVCFGNLGSRARGRRRYGWMMPDLLEAKCDELVFEFANRELVEADLWRQFSVPKDLGAGVIDVKSFHVETPEDVAERIRALLEHVPAERMRINPDCGFFQLPRWLSALKLKAMVAGTRIVRHELTGSEE